MKRKKNSRRKERRGSLSLSMETIIIIILGVTLLSLGLIFVKGIFDKTEELREAAFDDAERAMSPLDAYHEDKLTVPSIKVKRGESKKFFIYVNNQLDRK